MEGEDDVPTATQLMTAAEFLALPQDDGIDRMLLAGELLESPMVYRNRLHSRALTRMARFLDVWLDSQPEPQGQVLAGDAGVKLTTNPDTLFGVDVAYFTADVLQVQPRLLAGARAIPLHAGADHGRRRIGWENRVRLLFC